MRHPLDHLCIGDFLMPRLTVRSRGALLLALTISSSMLALGAARADAADDVESVVVVGEGQTRSVSTLIPSNLISLPPGTSVQKSLNILPGVSAQSIDALGVNEQSLTLQVRGFSTTHLGYTLDGMPLGDGAYNNYNGLSISRALISENLGRADLATGIAGLGIASTSNLGGAVIYTSSAPKQELGFTGTQTFGSQDSKRSFARFDTGEYAGFSAYLSGQYTEQDLFVNQGAYKTSYGKQVNGKAQYAFDRGTITAFMDLSRTNQADDPYLSKDQISRLGYDLGGYAPDWTDYTHRAACTATGALATPVTCVKPASPELYSDDTFTNGSILRNDDLFYLAGNYAFTDTLGGRLQVYRHTDKGAGNNFIAGISNQGTATTADDIPVQIRDTRYTINRDGVLGSLTYDLYFNHFQAGFWLEENTSSAARYIHTDVTGPSDLGLFLTTQPSTAQWVQQTQWGTQQFYVQDTVSLLDDTLTIDFGFKGTHAKSNAKAQPGIAATPAPSATAANTTQFATGTLTARDFFLPEVGARWKIAPEHEVYASYSENMAMFQGGFKLGPQSVSQAVWDVQGKTLVPETSRSFDFGYRYVTDDVQLSLAGYHVNFDNRLLQYNPCPTALASNPGCGNSFHNAGSVTSNGAELGVQWQPMPWLSWYNSASYDATTYDQDLNWCTTTGTTTTCALYATNGKQQVDTPKQLYSSVLTLKQDGFWASLQAKFTGRRYYTYTNDQGFGAYTTLDLGAGYDFGAIGAFSGAKFALNVTNLTDLRYAANFDNSVFAPNDPGGTILVAHSSAPRQIFATFGIAL
jgi:iron complex outermembrane receptor protein